MKLPTLTLVVLTGFIALPALSDTHGWQYINALPPIQREVHDTWKIQLNRDEGNHNAPDNRAISEDFFFAVQWSILWEFASLWATPGGEGVPRPVLFIQYGEEPSLHRQQETQAGEHESYLGAKMLF
ncbi:MAG: hypothetical protein CMK46_04010 [Porticoccus sp.]|uniref:hypothetical protein n=1 Tax=Porticoccus hydrocarbonoclasticus TaxID=1073414 RepID=UPI000C378AAC|nr:hypothetical protein [Porticoccus hydrocarbonoclasticus]MBG57436.1 hypothetical protein [Porticoccus sp.]